MNWKKVLGNTGVIQTHFALIPTYQVSEREIILIDSGSQFHPELMEDLTRLGMRASAVLTTHLHPDHIANNRALMDHFGTEIYASAEEIRDVGPRYASLHADPLEEKWLPTEPDYPILPYPALPGTLTVSGARFELLPTPGHTAGHVSIVTPDGVCCLGDAILSEKTLQASCLPFMEHDVDMAVESMSELSRTDYPCYIAAHLDVISPQKLPALAEKNIEKELELYDKLRNTIREPMQLEDAITAFMSACGVMREIMLRRSSMRSSAFIRFLALERAGELRIENGRVFPCVRGSER